MKEPSTPPRSAVTERESDRTTRQPRHRTVYLAISFLAACFLFDRVATSIAVGVLALLFYEIFYRRNLKVIAFTISAAVSVAAFEYAGRHVLRAQFGRYFHDDADHRLKPDPEFGINSDGIRCPVEHDDFTAETYNILFLGDSFTFGYRLKYEETMPAQVERMLHERYPGQQPRAVNFGWISSSPGPSRRLLEDIGAKYKPRLVIQCLDMSDFHDDLRVLEDKGYWDRSPTAQLLIRLGMRELVQELYGASRLQRFLRRVPELDRPVPADRFFVVNQPLRYSLLDMQETEHQLRETHRYCRDVLKADYILVMYPRHFQYSDRESPRNWERSSYRIFGPYVKEPFVWLEALRPRVPFPCYSLLEDFETTDVFPTCFEDDPHWTPAGARVAAVGILRVLAEESLLASIENFDP